MYVCIDNIYKYKKYRSFHFLISAFNAFFFFWLLLQFSLQKRPLDWYPCIRFFSVVLWALMEGNPHYIKWIENYTQHSNIFWFWDCVWPTVTTYHLHRRRLRSDSLWLKCSESCYYSTLNVSFTAHIRQALLINLNRNDERHCHHSKNELLWIYSLIMFSLCLTRL